MPRKITETRQIYTMIVDTHIAPVLLDRGFARLKKYYNWFYRESGDCLQRVSESFRPVRGRDEGWLSMHVAVGFASLTQLLATCPAVGEEIKAYAGKPVFVCETVGKREPRMEYWEWGILPDEDPSQLGREIVESLERYGLPYFGEMDCLGKAITAWEGMRAKGLLQSEVYFLAGAYWLSGDYDRAFALLESQYKQTKQDMERTGLPVDKTIHELDVKSLQWFRSLKRP